MRVLFVAPLTLDAATVRYRCGHLAEALHRAGHETEVVFADAAATVRVRHDVVVLHRLFWNGAGRRFHDAARAVGATVVYGVDDLIFEPEFAFHIGMLHPDDPRRFRYHRAEVEENREMLRRADAVLVSTEFLAERARALPGDAEQPVFVARNFPGAELRQLSETARLQAQATRDARTDDRVTLGYLSGSPTHDSDLADIAAPLAAVMRRLPQTRLIIVGSVALPAALHLADKQGRIRRHPAVPWRDLPFLLAGIDINLAPLDPTRAFAHGKSEVKFLEAALAGVPTIAGPARGFVEGVLPGEDCLVARTLSEWEDAIASLAADGDRRAQLAEAARTRILAHATPHAQAPHVSALFEEMRRCGPSRGDRGTTAGEILVQKPLRERLMATGKRWEAGAYGAYLRAKRHKRLLREELDR